MNREQSGKLLGAVIITNALYYFVAKVVELYQFFTSVIGASENQQGIDVVVMALAPSALLLSLIFLVSASLGWLLFKGKEIKLAVAITAGIANIFNGSVGFGLAIIYLIYHVAGSSKDQQHNKASKGTQ